MNKIHSIDLLPVDHALSISSPPQPHCPSMHAWTNANILTTSGAAFQSAHILLHLLSSYPSAKLYPFTTTAPSDHLNGRGSGISRAWSTQPPVNLCTPATTESLSRGFASWLAWTFECVAWITHGHPIMGQDIVGHAAMTRTLDFSNANERLGVRGDEA